ncbi:hypothetical protein QTO34_007309 [Cnephaeus nilssonii]|uniref:Uncharacterized protein n=1 Tax=Cnephaeus nilssonii TaxID=3371016 RepID=A0AA40LGG8_CNENI|nr:hypothetical protein QTO34_007309 [Eptesicus nilssonii]
MFSADLGGVGPGCRSESRPLRPCVDVSLPGPRCAPGRRGRSTTRAPSGAPAPPGTVAMSGASRLSPLGVGLGHLVAEARDAARTLPHPGHATRLQCPAEWPCNRVPDERRYSLPLKSVYMRQIDQMVGLI